MRSLFIVEAADAKNADRPSDEYYGEGLKWNQRVRFKHIIYNGYLSVENVEGRGLVWTLKGGKVDGTIFALKMKDYTEDEDIRVSDQIRLMLEGNANRPDLFFGTAMVGTSKE